MPTIGLKGIWGLEQLGNIEIASWKLYVLLTVTSIIIGVVLIVIAGDVSPHSALASYYTPRVVFSALMGVCGLSALSIFANILVARLTSYKQESSRTPEEEITHRGVLDDFQIL